MSHDPISGVAVPGICPIAGSTPQALKNPSIEDRLGGKWKICYLNDNGSRGEEVPLQYATIQKITPIFQRELLSGFDETSIKGIDQIDLGGFHKAITSHSMKDQETFPLSPPQKDAMEKIQRIVSEWVTPNNEKSNGLSFVAKSPDQNFQTHSSDGNQGRAAEHEANDGLNGSPQPTSQLSKDQLGKSSSTSDASNSTNKFLSKSNLTNSTNNSPASTRPSLYNDLRKWFKTSTKDKAEQLASVLNTPNAIPRISNELKKRNLPFSWDRVLTILKEIEKRENSKNHNGII